LGDQHEEAGQVLVFAAQPVAEPRAGAGAAGLLGTGHDVGRCGVVIDRLGVERFDDRDVVHDASHVWKQFAHPRAALAVLIEFEDWRGAGERSLAGGHAGDSLAISNVRRELGAVELLEGRLVVEQIDVRGTAAHEEIDDALGGGGEIEGAHDAAGLIERVGCARKKRRVEQRCQCSGADAGGASAKELAAGQETLVFLNQVHVVLRQIASRGTGVSPVRSRSARARRPCHQDAV